MITHPGDPRPPPPQIQEKCLPDELSSTESEGNMTGETKTRNKKQETRRKPQQARNKPR